MKAKVFRMDQTKVSVVDGSDDLGMLAVVLK